MRRALAVLLAVAGLAAAPLAASAAGASKEHMSHAYVPPDPASLGGTFVLRDPVGRMVSSQNLKGRWSLVYVGYSRCTDTCPVALPSIVQAAKDLSAAGIPARAVFIDIEPPPASVRPRNPDLKVTEAAHHDPLKQQQAMAEIVKRFGPSLLVLTGSRNQLSAVTVAFQVRREHVPARPKEEGHSINHTSFIYLMAPSGEVKQYLYHNAAPDVLSAAVRKSAALR